MNRAAGLFVSEIVTYVLIALVLVAVAFGRVVSSERDAMAELAQASIKQIKELTEASTSTGQPVMCDNTLVAPEVLANSFLSLSIKPILKDVEDVEDGFAPGLHVRSKKKEDGEDGFVTAKRLLEAVKEHQEDSLRELYDGDELIEYFVLISDQVSCVNQSRLASSEATEG